MQDVWLNKSCSFWWVTIAELDIDINLFSFSCDWLFSTIAWLKFMICCDQNKFLFIFFYKLLESLSLDPKNSSTFLLLEEPTQALILIWRDLATASTASLKYKIGIKYLGKCLGIHIKKSEIPTVYQILKAACWPVYPLCYPCVYRSILNACWKFLFKFDIPPISSWM